MRKRISISSLARHSSFRPQLEELTARIVPAALANFAAGAVATNETTITDEVLVADTPEQSSGDEVIAWDGIKSEAGPEQPLEIEVSATGLDLLTAFPGADEASPGDGETLYYTTWLVGEDTVGVDPTGPDGDGSTLLDDYAGSEDTDGELPGSVNTLFPLNPGDSKPDDSGEEEVLIYTLFPLNPGADDLEVSGDDTGIVNPQFPLNPGADNPTEGSEAGVEWLRDVEDGVPTDYPPEILYFMSGPGAPPAMAEGTPATAAPAETISTLATDNSALMASLASSVQWQAPAPAGTAQFHSGSERATATAVRVGSNSANAVEPVSNFASIHPLSASRSVADPVGGTHAALLDQPFNTPDCTLQSAPVQQSALSRRTFASAEGAVPLATYASASLTLTPLDLDDKVMAAGAAEEVARLQPPERATAPDVAMPSALLSLATAAAALALTNRQRQPIFQSR